MVLVGDTNEEKIYNFLYERLKNHYAVAGLMGNIYAESGLNPKNLQNNGNRILGMTDEDFTKSVDNGKYTNFIRDSYGYGICQWTYWNRKQNLLNYAKTCGSSIGDLGMQLSFLVYELQNAYRSVWYKLLSSTSVRHASDVVLTEFEKPADQSENVKIKRASYGQIYFEKYAQNKNQNQISNSEKSTTKYYRVQCGAFSNENHAKKLNDELKAKGFNCVIKKLDNLFKLQLGAYSNRDNAEKMLLKVKSKGFDAIIVYY